MRSPADIATLAKLTIERSAIPHAQISARKLNVIAWANTFIAREPADGTRVEIDLAASEREPQARRTIRSLVDAITAEHHQMNSDRQCRQFDQKLFAEAAYGNDSLADQRRFVETTIAFGFANDPADERFGPFAKNDD